MYENNSGSGFNDGAWWIIILLIFGWGGNRGGYGFGGNNGGTLDGYVLTSDFATLERKLDTLQAGICDSTYALNNSINGTNALINTQGFETRNAINGISAQLAACCCDIEKSLLENRYISAQNTCTMTNAINNSSRDIIDNANSNYRAIHEELVANKLEAKNERIAELTQQLSLYQLKASQEAQNNYLLSEIRPCPRPAYLTCNPYASYYQPYGCGCNGAIVQ